MRVARVAESDPRAMEELIRPIKRVPGVRGVVATGFALTQSGPDRAVVMDHWRCLDCHDHRLWWWVRSAGERVGCEMTRRLDQHE